MNGYVFGVDIDLLLDGLLALRRHLCGYRPSNPDVTDWRCDCKFYRPDLPSQAKMGAREVTGCGEVLQAIDVLRECRDVPALQAENAALAGVISQARRALGPSV